MNIRKPAQVPCKAEVVAQAEFIAEFEELQTKKEADEVHYFIDAVHPTLNSEASYGWIEKGEEHQIQSNSGRRRANLLGALNPNDVTDIITKEYKTINSEWAADFFVEIGKRNPEAKKIIVFSDNAGYFKKLEKDGLITDQRIEIVWLPTYSPNLNAHRKIMEVDEEKSIEKQVLWNSERVSRKNTRVFLENIKDYKTELESLLTCNFRVVSFS